MTDEIRTLIDKKYLSEITEFNRPLWEQWKGENGVRVGFGSKGVLKVPGFLESLRSLHFDQGYGLTEIGSMLGVTRERVRQYLGFQTKKISGSQARIWDDEINRFVSVDNSYEVTKRRNQNKKINRRFKERKRQIEVIQKFAAENGRPPYITELGRILYPDNTTNQFQNEIAAYWGRRQGKMGVSYTEAIDALYAAAGFENRLRRIRINNKDEEKRKQVEFIQKYMSEHEGEVPTKNIVALSLYNWKKDPSSFLTSVWLKHGRSNAESIDQMYVAAGCTERPSKHGSIRNLENKVQEAKE